jgi:S-adenosylmethionine hydrolase
VTLTTDFGTADGYTAAVKGVLMSRAPAARLLDLSHDLRPHDVIGAAWLLLRAVPFFPPETIHLAVVDPGVGSARRALLLEIGGQFFVGPDNGLFSLIPHRLAGPWRGVALDRARFPTWASSSAVFDGRDLLAPAAASLANALAERAAGGPRTLPLDLSPFGDPVAEWERLPWSEPRPEGADWVGEVVRVDRFGNAVLNLTPAHGPGPLEVKGRVIARKRVYADVPSREPVALEGSSGFLEIAVNQGSASEELGLAVGEPVRLRPEAGGTGGRERGNAGRAGARAASGGGRA